MNPNIASLLLGLYALFLVVVLIRARHRLIAKLGHQGYLLLWGYMASFIMPAFCWVFGLSSLFTDVADPVLRGTGGNYGLNYNYYLEAIEVYIAAPTLIALFVTFLVPRREVYSHNRNILTKIGSELRVDRIARTAFVVSIILVVWYFYVVGWDRFWYSESSRFEYTSEKQAEFSIKIALTFVLAFGCVGAALAVFRGAFWLSTATVTIASLPFCAFASRGMSVLFAAYAVAIFLRLRNKWRWLATPLLALGVYVTLQLPLVMRGTGQTGVRVAIETLVTADKGVTLSDTIAASLLNIGQGFGLMVEEREVEASGVSLVKDIPKMYFILSLSPTLSVVDGFSSNWVYYNPRHNEYTPYGGMTELVSFNLILGIFLPPFTYLISIWLCRKMTGRSLWHDAGLFAFVLVISLGLVQLQQYPLRTATRFFYAAFALFGFLAFVAFMLRTHAAGKPVARILNMVVKPTMLKGMTTRGAQTRSERS